MASPDRVDGQGVLEARVENRQNREERLGSNVVVSDGMEVGMLGFKNA